MAADLAHTPMPLPNNGSSQPGLLASTNICQSADKIMMLLERDRRPLLQRLEEQDHRIFRLEIVNKELKGLLERERVDSRGKMEALWKRIEGLQRELGKLKGEGNGWQKNPQEIPLSEPVAGRMQGTKQKTDNSDSSAQAGSNQEAEQRKPHLNAQQQLLHQLESSRRQAMVAELDAQVAIRNAERLRDTARRLKNGLENVGVTYIQNEVGTFSIGFNDDILRVFLDIVAEAKRRGLIPDTVDVAALERGEIKLFDLATLVHKLIVRLRANETKIYGSLKTGLEKGRTVQDWFQWLEDSTQKKNRSIHGHRSAGPGPLGERYQG